MCYKEERSGGLDSTAKKGSSAQRSMLSGKMTSSNHPTETFAETLPTELMSSYCNGPIYGSVHLFTFNTSHSSIRLPNLSATFFFLH